MPVILRGLKGWVTAKVIPSEKKIIFGCVVLFILLTAFLSPHVWVFPRTP